MNHKKIYTALILLIVLIGILFFINKKQDKETIKIGFFGPISGEAAPYGEPSRNALIIAIDELNSSGGIKGKKVELVVEDSKCNGKDAISAVQKLIQVEKVDYLIGGSCSSEVIAVLPIIKESNKILISPFASSSEISNQGVFRIVPSTDDAGPYIASDLIRRYKKIAIITEKTDFTTSVEKSLSENYSTLGGIIVSSEQVIDKNSDYKTTIQKIKSTNPEVLYINTQSGATASKIVTQVKQAGLDIPVVTFFITGSDFISNPNTDDVIIFDAPSLSENIKSKSFQDNYIKKYGKPDYMFAAGSAYDALYILKDAILSGAQETSEVKKYLFSMSNFNGVTGDISFKSTGDIKGIGLAKYRVMQGVLIKE